MHEFRRSRESAVCALLLLRMESRMQTPSRHWACRSEPGFQRRGLFRAQGAIDLPPRLRDGWVYNRGMSIVVGIAGGTGSGKTSFAERLREKLGPDRCLSIAEDSYYKDGSALSPAERSAFNYDHPDAFDASLLVEDIRDLKAGRPVPHLTYDHATYVRRVLPDPLSPAPGGPPRGNPGARRGAAPATHGHQALHRHGC